MTMPDIHIIRELEDAGTRLWQDITFLYPLAVERLYSFTRVDKTKLHFLTKVINKDALFIPLNCSPNSVRHRLSELAQLQKLNANKKGKNEVILKCARNVRFYSKSSF